jgi:hypothetical protein
VAHVDDKLELLLAILDHAFNQVSWHGPNLTGSLRGVSAKVAVRSVAGRRSIWEQVLHAAYWKQRVLNKLIGTQRFPRKGSNWPHVPPNPTEAAWRQDIALLHEIHGRLREAVAALGPERLADPKLVRLIHGVAFHDVYHAGQIRLLRRLLGL